MANYNNLSEEFNEDGYDNENNFYYLTENETNQPNHILNELNENIYQEDNISQENNIEHMQQSNLSRVNNVTKPTQHVTKPTQHVEKKQKIVKKESKPSSINWLYVFLIILVIALIVYYLIEKKYIKLPNFDSSSSSLSNTISPSSLGSTFMSLH